MDEPREATHVLNHRLEVARVLASKSLTSAEKRPSLALGTRRGTRTLDLLIRGQMVGVFNPGAGRVTGCVDDVHQDLHAQCVGSTPQPCPSAGSLVNTQGTAATVSGGATINTPCHEGRRPHASPSARLPTNHAHRPQAVGLLRWPSPRKPHLHQRQSSPMAALGAATSADKSADTMRQRCAASAT